MQYKEHDCSFFLYVLACACEIPPRSSAHMNLRQGNNILAIRYMSLTQLLQLTMGSLPHSYTSYHG